MDIFIHILKVLNKFFNTLLRRKEIQLKDDIIVPSIIISKFSNDWNRHALSYSLNRRSLAGRLPILRTPEHDIIDKDDSQLPEVQLSISKSTNEWNKYALEFVRNKRLQDDKDKIVLKKDDKNAR